MRTWSVSSIRQFHSCQLAWWFQRTGVAPEFKPLALVEGTAVHAAIEQHLLGLRDGDVPSEEDGVELLRASYFSEEAGGAIRYGQKEHGEVLDRLSNLYVHWRRNLKLDGDIVGVETETRTRTADGLDVRGRVLGGHVLGANSRISDSLLLHLIELSRRRGGLRTQAVVDAAAPSAEAAARPRARWATSSAAPRASRASSA